jgi:hypothetical protein
LVIWCATPTQYISGGAPCTDGAPCTTGLEIGAAVLHFVNCKWASMLVPRRRVRGSSGVIFTSSAPVHCACLSFLYTPWAGRMLRAAGRPGSPATPMRVGTRIAPHPGASVCSPTRIWCSSMLCALTDVCYGTAGGFSPKKTATAAPDRIRSGWCARNPQTNRLGRAH